MSQPVWRFTSNLGDSTPLQYGGLFLYTDETGAYPPELEKLEPNDDGTFTVHRVPLYRLKCVGPHLVPIHYAPSHPCPATDYVPWFMNDLASVASYIGSTVKALQTLLMSGDPKDLAIAYMAIYDYHGWDNGDSYPYTLESPEMTKRYTQGELG